MTRYTLIRFLQSLLALFMLLTITFFAAYVGGDPMKSLAGPRCTFKQAEMLRAFYGLDKPIYVQYWKYLSHLARGDLGKSIIIRRSVGEIIRQRIPASIELIIASMAITLIIALPMGVYSAVRRGRPFDMVARSFAMVGQSIPVFWFGLMLMMVFAVWLHLLPTCGRDQPTSIILPAFVLGYSMAAGVLRLTRSAMLDVLDSEYVKLARIKGVSERLVIWKHAFRNALLPVVTYTAVKLALLVAGAITTEVVFAWPGLGQLVIQAATERDIPLLQALVLLIGLTVLAVNLLVDLLYVYLDPKIRYAK